MNRFVPRGNGCRHAADRTRVRRVRTSPAPACGSPAVAGLATADGRRPSDACYRNWSTRRWPERYNYAARQPWLAPFARRSQRPRPEPDHLELVLRARHRQADPGRDGEARSMARRRPARTRGCTSRRPATSASPPRTWTRSRRLRERLNADAAATVQRYMATSRSARSTTKCSSTTRRAEHLRRRSPATRSAARPAATSAASAAAGGTAASVGGRRSGPPPGRR